MKWTFLASATSLDKQKINSKMVFLEGSSLPSPLLFELLRCGCCVKCCLRIAGVQNRALYKRPDEDALEAIGKCAEGNAEWQNLIQQYKVNMVPLPPVKVQQNPVLSNVSVGKTAVDSGDCITGSGGSGSGDGGGTAAGVIGASAAETICVLCLGVLQNCVSLDAENSVTSASSSVPSLRCRVAEEVAAKIRGEGYEIVDYNLSVTLPGACSIRSGSMWYHLGTAFARMFATNPVDAPEELKNAVGPIHSDILESVKRQRNQSLGLKDVLKSLVNEFLPKLIPGVQHKALCPGDCNFSILVAFEHDGSTKVSDSL
jgi:hypothetical protein